MAYDPSSNTARYQDNFEGCERTPTDTTCGKPQPCENNEYTIADNAGTIAQTCKGAFFGCACLLSRNPPYCRAVTSPAAKDKSRPCPTWASALVERTLGAAACRLLAVQRRRTSPSTARSVSTSTVLSLSHLPLVLTKSCKPPHYLYLSRPCFNTIPIRDCTGQGPHGA